MEVVHTGAGIDSAVLTLTNVRFREVQSESTFNVHVNSLELQRGQNQKLWHGNLFNREFSEIVNAIEFKVIVQNNMGHGTPTTVISEFGNNSLIIIAWRIYCYCWEHIII